VQQKAPKSQRSPLRDFGSARCASVSRPAVHYITIQMEAVPIVGPVITGLLIGRGSNVTKRLFKRLQVVQVSAAKADAVVDQGVVMPLAQLVMKGGKA
jgi:hypothetical protein